MKKRENIRRANHSLVIKGIQLNCDGVKLEEMIHESRCNYENERSLLHYSPLFISGIPAGILWQGAAVPASHMVDRMNV